MNKRGNGEKGKSLRGEGDKRLVGHMLQNEGSMHGMRTAAQLAPEMDLMGLSSGRLEAKHGPNLDPLPAPSPHVRIADRPDVWWGGN